MIAGLHWTAWLLLAAAVGLGLVIELRFYLAHRGRQGAEAEAREEGSKPK